MKKIFRKAMTVLASSALIGMTVGTAFAASYPTPFTTNTAIVVGANAAPSDNIAASSIASNLDANAVSTGTTVVIGDGDSFKIEKTSTKFHLGDSILDVVSTSLDDKDLPELLADGVYVDDDNNEFDFKQTVSMANKTLEMFDDDDYKRDSPTIGFKYSSGDNVLDYTLDFTENPDWEDIVSTDLTIMGKEYYVLSTSLNTSITLLDSASDTILSEGESATLTVDGTAYAVAINFISETTVKLTVNGETTNSLANSGTYKLSDGSYIGSKDIMYTAKDTGISQVEFSIGNGKLVLANGDEVEMNEEDIDNLDVTITSTGATPNELNTVVLSWNMDDEGFVTDDSSITMPGFNTISVAFGGLNYPAEEEVVVKADGDDNLVLQNFPLADVTETINLLYSDGTNFTLIGKDSNNLVKTAGIGDSLTFTDNVDDYFVLSYMSGDDAESYLVRATNWEDSDYPDNVIDFEYKTDSGWTNVDTAVNDSDEVSLGNALFTVSGVANESISTVVVTAGADTNFDRLYSVEGLEVQLPWVNETAVDIISANNITGTYANDAAACTGASLSLGTGQLGYNQVISYTVTADNLTDTATCLSTPATYDLILSEEDEDDAISGGDDITVAIGLDGDSEVYITSVSTTPAGADAAEIGEGEIYRDFAYSALATEILDDQSGDSESVTIVYHGGEVSADVYVTSAGAIVSTAGTSVGVMTVKDSEVDSVSGKNLVVVGGSAINAVAAELLGGAYSEVAFTSATGVAAGEFMIKSFSRTGNTALLVAGYNAADTEKAVTYLLNNDIVTTVGTNYKGTSATEAGLVVTA